MTAATQERLVSCDSHVLYTDEWVLPRLPRMEAFMGLLVGLLGALITQRELQSHPGTRLRWPAILLLLVLLVALARAPAAALAGMTVLEALKSGRVENAIGVAASFGEQAA